MTKTLRILYWIRHVYIGQHQHTLSWTAKLTHSGSPSLCPLWAQSYWAGIGISQGIYIAKHNRLQQNRNEHLTNLNIKLQTWGGILYRYVVFVENTYIEKNGICEDVVKENGEEMTTVIMMIVMSWWMTVTDNSWLTGNYNRQLDHQQRHVQSQDELWQTLLSTMSSIFWIVFCLYHYLLIECEDSLSTAFNEVSLLFSTVYYTEPSQQRLSVCYANT